MNKNLSVIGIGVMLSSCVTPQRLKTVDSFQPKASTFGCVLTLPAFERSATEITNAVHDAMDEAEIQLDRFGRQDVANLNFTNTIRALYDITYPVMRVANRVYLMKETSTDPAIRDAATALIKELDEWFVGLDYREDIFNVVTAYEKSNPILTGEDKKLYEETLRDYKRAGLYLPKDEREHVERLRKELTKLTTDFQRHITEAKAPLVFIAEELEGLPESFLNSPGIKTGDQEYTLMAHVTWHALTLLRNAKHEETRKHYYLARNSLAKEKNIPILGEILSLRHDIATRLGYASWADYRIEPKMAGTAANARAFLLEMHDGLQPKFEAEREKLRQLKINDTHDEQAEIHAWDWRYYANELKKLKYNVDTEALRVYFPYKQVLDGMFTIYETIFGITLEEVEAPYKWINDLRLFVVTDTVSGEPLGCFYLDMFPREGKYNHFAQFGIIDGHRLPDGRYQRPTVALIFNFPPPSEERPSLLSHSDVETLFHEFGHAMHSILTRATYSRFSGTSVPCDFVEAPSQMLEHWVWDKEVLDDFAADYRDPSQKIPKDVLDQMEAAKKAVAGFTYRRQLSFGMLDLVFHNEEAGQERDIVKISNRILSEVLLPVPEETAFVTHFGHLMGYDAGYYGYVWSEAIAEDMATIFKSATGGLMDPEIGMKLRREIYEPGDSRDVRESIERFLGRKQSNKPFFEELGIQ